MTAPSQAKRGSAMTREEHSPVSPLRPDSTIARPGGFQGNERKVAESSGNGYSCSMVLDRVKMTTDVSDVDTPWIVNYPQVESAGGAHHGVELV